MVHKTFRLNLGEKEVKWQALLKLLMLLSKLGIKSDQPHNIYGDLAAARIDIITKLMQSGMISPAEARRMLDV